MNIKQITNNAKKELQKQNIEYTDIYILETKWGYVVQTKYAKLKGFLNLGKIMPSFAGRQIEELKAKELGIPQYDCKDSFISLFYDDGQSFFPFTKIKTNFVSGIYNRNVEDTEFQYQEIDIEKMMKEDKNDHYKFFNLFSYKVDLTGNINFGEEIIQYKELDDRYFIVPIVLDKEMIALFYIDDNNRIIYCGNTPGDIYSFNEQLAKNKTLLLKYENNEFLFSWEKNSIISDRWSKIAVNGPFYMKLDLKNIKNMVPEIIEYIINFVEKCGGFLAILEVKSRYSEEQIQFFSVLRSDGVAITDLMYITDTYEMKAMKLKGEPVGTLDSFREETQKKLDERALMIENNKKNMLETLSLLTDERGEYTEIETDTIQKSGLSIRKK